MANDQNNAIHISQGRITQDTFNRASEKLKGDKEFRSAGAMEMGSVEARSTILAHSKGGKNDPMIKIAEKQLSAGEEAVRWLRNLNKKEGVPIFQGL